MTPVPNAERQAAWRARRREQGLASHPEREHRAAAGRPRRPERHARPWLFVDTEGANDPDGVFGDPGRQWTFLICAASDDGYERVLRRDRPLTTVEMLDFLLELPTGRHGSHKAGGFFFGYDIAQIVWELGEDDLYRLYRLGLPVLYKGKVISLFNTQLRLAVPRERLSSPPDDMNELRDCLQATTIWDVGKFYQAGLVKAIENWQVAGAREAEFVEAMKTQRTDFDLAYWRKNGKRLVEYSLLENRLGARMQNKFDETCRELGYPLTDWYGAGSMAKAMMRAHGVAEHLKDRRPIRRSKKPEEDLAARLPSAYFGGRFEIQAPGEYSPVYEYDLRSAYPASYRELPCLVHGTWTQDRRQTGLDVGPSDLVEVSWRCPSTYVWGPFPHRDKHGTITYPLTGIGNVYGVEYLAAARQFKGLEIRRHWRYRATSSCRCRPFGWIDEVYEQRKALGKDTAGFPLKLGMNACYGRLASVLGSIFHDGTFAGGMCEPRWAGLITAWSRAQLLSALELAGGPRSRSVLMFATDAIYTTQPIDGLDLSDRLGGWECHVFPKGGLLIQPGLYHLKGQRTEVKLKGRGITFRDMQDRIQSFYRAWRAHGTDAEVTLTMSPRYMGIRLMLAQNNLEGAWRWKVMDRTIRFTPKAKRAWRRGAWQPHRGEQVASVPHPGMELLITGIPMQLAAISDDQLWLELTESDQPEGPMAL